MSLAYPSRASRGVAFGLAVVAVLLAASAPVEAATVNYIEGAWATSGGTNPAYVATGSDTNISIVLTPKGTGGVGIATTSPQSLLHVYGGEVQVGSSGASCAAANNGAIRFSGSTLYYCDGSNWQTISNSNSGTALNAISAATANQAGIANAAYTIQWNWDTLTTGTALKIASTSMTTGSLLNLSNTNAVNSTGKVLSVTNAENAGINYGVYGSDASAAGFGVYGSNAASGVAIQGESDGTTDGATGVVGGAYGATGQSTGVEGDASSTTAGARGVYGKATGATGATYGVYGSDASATGYGGYFTNTNGGYALATGSGNVGIGALAPAYPFDVESTGVVTAKIGTTYTGGVNSYQSAVLALTNNMSAGETNMYKIGQADSSKNVGYFGFVL